MQAKKKPGPVRNERGHPTAAHVQPMPYGGDLYIKWLSEQRAKRAGRKERHGLGGRPSLSTNASLQKQHGGMKGRNQ